jgi:hypothetical protein
VFVLGVGEFTGLDVTALDIVLMGQGSTKTIVGNIHGTSGSIYGIGPHNITVGDILIQPAAAAVGTTGHASTSTPAGNGATGTDSTNTTVAGLTVGTIELVSGNGGAGGYGGDSSLAAGTVNGGNGGNAGNCGTLTVVDCIYDWAVNYSGLGGAGGQGSISTDATSDGGNGGNGGDGGTPGVVIVKNSTGDSFYAGSEGGGSAGPAGTPGGNVGNAGNSSGPGTVTTYFVTANAAPANGETSNLNASYINGVWTSSTWGQIRGDLADQTDIHAVLATKEPNIISGANDQWLRGDKTFQSLTPGDVSLGNVENTALSTWAGSANITTLGAISSGTWNATYGSVVPATKGGTGQTSLQSSLNALAAASGSLAQGDILYHNGTNVVRLPAGTANQYLQTQGAGANPRWNTVSATGTVTSVAATVPAFLSVTGSPITSSGTLAITLSGSALPVANGGTGQTTLQATINALAAASGALSRGDLLYYNGTNVVRLPAGNANYVLNTGGAGADPSWGSNAITIAGVSTALGGTITQDTITGLASTGLVKRTAANTLGIATAGTDYLTTSTVTGLTQFGVSMANNTAVTGVSLGTITDTTSRPLTISQTWNNAGLSATAVNINVTVTSSAGTGTLFRVGTAGVDVFKILENQTFSCVGSGSFGANLIAAGTVQATGGELTLGNATYAIKHGATALTQFFHDGSYKEHVRNGTNANWFGFANTWTSSTSYETAVIDWQTTANTLRLGSDVGSGGGSARDVQLVRGGTVAVTLGANTNTHAIPVKLPSYIVSGLPSASTCGAGSMAFVTDATLTTSYTTVIGGGSSKVLVISDGTNWIIH